MRSVQVVATLVLFSLVSLGSCRTAPKSSGGYLKFGSVEDAIESLPFLSTLKAAVKAVGLDKDLIDPKFKGTVFAPHDRAFNALLRDWDISKDDFLNDTKTLKDVLLYHLVLDDTLTSDDLQDGAQVETAQGQKVTVTADKYFFFKRITVRGAGNDERFNVIIADVEAGDSIIHVIDGVLLPEEEEDDEDDDRKSFDTLIDAIVNQPELSTFLAAVAVADAGIDLADEDAHSTIFAPTNKAFDDLLDKLDITRTELFQDTKLLHRVLQYHIIPDSSAESEDLEDGDKLETLLRHESLRVQFKGDDIIIKGARNDAKVIKADFEGGTGVLHLIDAVLIPPDDEEAGARAILKTSTLL